MGEVVGQTVLWNTNSAVRSTRIGEAKHCLLKGPHHHISADSRM